jgi:hypothetical protein
MGKRVRIALAVLAVALVSVTVWQVAQPSEPIYQGKPLSSWMKGYMMPDPPTFELLEPQRQAADKALRHLGTNAIPTLLRMLRVRDSALKVKLMNLAQRQHIIKIGYTPAKDWNLAAQTGFFVLGAEAQSAVPALIEIVNQDISFESQYSAVFALGYIGPSAKEAVPMLLQWTTNADPFVHGCVLNALLKIDPEAAARVGMK